MKIKKRNHAFRSCLYWHHPSLSILLYFMIGPLQMSRYEMRHFGLPVLFDFTLSHATNLSYSLHFGSWPITTYLIWTSFTSTQILNRLCQWSSIQNGLNCTNLYHLNVTFDTCFCGKAILKYSKHSFEIIYMLFQNQEKYFVVFKGTSSTLHWHVQPQKGYPSPTATQMDSSLQYLCHCHHLHPAVVLHFWFWTKVISSCCIPQLCHYCSDLWIEINKQ